MSVTVSPSAISIFAFAVTSSLCVGFSGISKQLRHLKTEIILRNQRDFRTRVSGTECLPLLSSSSKKIDLLLEMHSLVSHENLEVVIERVVGVAYNIFRAQRISVMILNRKKTHFTVISSKDAEGKEIDASKGIGSVVVSSGELLNVKNAYQDSRFNPQCDLMTGFRTETLLCAPLIANNETVGVVYVINKLDDSDEISEFSKEDEELLEYFAATASVAIKKSQLYHDALRGEKNAHALLSIVRSRSSNEVLESVFLSTINTVSRLLLPACISVFICDQTSQEAWVCVSMGGVDGISVKFGQGIAGTVAANGQTVRVADAYKDGRFDPTIDRKTGYTTRSVLCVGVPGFASTSKPVAVLQLLNKLNGKPFTQDDEDSLEILSKELSISLKRKIEEMSFLRRATLSRNNPDKDKHMRLEESFLNEFGAVSQCFKFRSSQVIGKHCTNPDGDSGDDSSIDGTGPSALLPSVDDDVALRTREIINKWDFSPFAANDSDLMQYSVQMLMEFDLIDTLKIDVRKLKNFIMGAHALYHEDAHFHNFKHAWSVMHMSYLILRHGASDFLTPLDILSVLLAALCHDLDHPGTNNGYEVASQSELALTHSYDSVLERHHASMTHRLLCSANSNILDNMSAVEKTYVTEVMTEAILATNMSVHFSHVSQLEGSSKSSPPFDVSSAASRRHLVGHVVHTADLSGQALPLELAKVWGDRCLAEFMFQAKQEKLNGYPVTEYMAALDSDLQCNQAQVGFVGNIVLPLWTAMADCFPALELRCSQAQSNFDYYSHCVRLEMSSEKDSVGS